MTTQAPLLYPQVHYCEVTSIYQKRDFPPPTPRECIGTAENPEHTQARTWWKLGETQGKTVLLWPQTLSCIILLSKTEGGSGFLRWI